MLTPGRALVAGVLFLVLAGFGSGLGGYLGAHVSAVWFILIIVSGFLTAAGILFIDLGRDLRRR